MTDKQPEPEYIITESQLKKLYWNCGSASPAMSDMGEELRSRPYHPAPEPTQKYLDCKVCEDEIRQSEREKVLDELGNKLYCEFHAYQITLDGRDVVTGYKKVIESLRKVE